MALYSWMTAARKVSLKSDFKHRLGAVIVKGGRILSKGYNEIRFCQDALKYSKWKESLHAERSAIRKCSNESLEGASIFIYREHKSGCPANAYPCPSCLELIKSKKIKRVFYSISVEPYYGVIKL